MSSDYRRLSASYLRNASGIPGIQYKDRGIIAPDPYRFTVSTDLSHRRFAEAIYATRDMTGLPIHIRNNRLMGSTDQALAGMTLHTLAILLGSHYNAVVLPRLERME